MNRILAFLLTWTGIFLGNTFAGAQEPPEAELEFIRNLRLKGYIDLAKEHMEKLEKRNDPQILAFLPLEQARTLLSIAKEKEINQRGALFDSARKIFEGYAQKYSGKMEGHLAQLELARLLTLHGQTIVSLAMREEDLASQHKSARPAEGLFAQAETLLDQVLMAYPEEVKDNPSLSAELAKAQFERSAIIMEQAKSIIDTESDEKVRAQRANLIADATKRFEEMTKSDKKGIDLLAKAYLVKCYIEAQEPLRMNKVYQQVLESKEKAPFTATRLARFFYIQIIQLDITIKWDKKKDPYAVTHRIQAEAKKWLEDYPKYKKTPEGQGVQYELAANLFSEAMQKDKELKSTESKGLANQSQKYLTALVDLGGDYSEKANQMKIAIDFKVLGANTKTDDILTFEKMFLKAQFEMIKLNQAAKKIDGASGATKEKVEAEYKTHLKNTITYLQLALNLAESKTPIGQVDEARKLLVSAYKVGGDPFRTAVAGEILARTRPTTKSSSLGAGYAIEAYSNLFNRDANDAYRGRLLELAEFVISPEMQKLWVTDPVSGIARFHLGMVYAKDEKFKESLNHLEKLPADFPAYTYALAKLVFIAKEAKKKSPEEDQKKFYQTKIFEALKRMPPINNGTDTSTMYWYFNAQMEVPLLLIEQANLDLNNSKLPEAMKKYEEITKFIEEKDTSFTKVQDKLPKEEREQLNTLINSIRKIAQLGKADLEYSKGDYASVLTNNFAGKTVKEVMELGKNEGPIVLKDFQISERLLSLALRANVQLGKIDEAQKIYGLFDRIKSPENNPTEGTNLLRALVSDLQQQVKRLKTVNDVAGLKSTVQNFGGFIDILAEKEGKNPKNQGKGMDLTTIIFLGTCYSSLDQYKKAGDLYAKIPEPKCLSKTGKLTEDEEKEIGTYWFLQVQGIKMNRLANKSLWSLPAEDTKRAEAVKATLKKINDSVNHPQARLQMMVEMEKYHLFMDTELWGNAIKGWGEIMKNPTVLKQMQDNDRVREIYFECYYQHVYCWYKYSQTPKVVEAKTSPKYLRNAANYIYRLEIATNQRGWQALEGRFRELLNNEKILKDEYEKLKSEQKAK